jgi:hypothetical protein
VNNLPRTLILASAIVALPSCSDMSRESTVGHRGAELSESDRKFLQALSDARNPAHKPAEIREPASPAPPPPEPDRMFCPSEFGPPREDDGKLRACGSPILCYSPSDVDEAIAAYNAHDVAWIATFQGRCTRAVEKGTTVVKIREIDVLWQVRVNGENLWGVNYNFYGPRGNCLTSVC